MPATATDTDYTTIEFEVADRIGTITLNRPDVFNAFDDTLSKELLDALKKAERNREVRVIILTGAGKAFCSGQDLGDLKAKYVPGHVPHLGDDLKYRYNPIIKRITSMEKPVIAAVNGVAAGAGCSLALACDMRLASQYASFIEVFINVGLIPDSASSWHLTRFVGLGKAMEMCMTSQKIGAEEALQLGLVNTVCPADELAEKTRALASKIVAMPERGIALTKRLLRQGLENSLAQQLEAEMYAQETAGQTEDHFEGVTAFLEKRKPDFK
ncbi:MAG: enoyl-CoA hydratase-related protein [Planctomycetota bacterium]|nr:enoyl-CoA hydratase-related protein [Planctomycetota bacterium]